MKTVSFYPKVYVMMGAIWAIALHWIPSPFGGRE